MSNKFEFEKIVNPYIKEFTFNFDGFSCWREGPEWVLTFSLAPPGESPTDPLLFQTRHATLDGVAEQLITVLDDIGEI
jgi:hypothetical protein